MLNKICQSIRPDTGCTLLSDSLGVGQTAVFNCTFTPTQSGIIEFLATGSDALTNTEVSAEATISVELLPINPPTVPTFSQYLPLISHDYFSQTPLGEPNDTCSQAAPISINQPSEFLAEDVNDWYQFTLDSASDLTAKLTNFAPIAGQITLWRGNCQNLTFLGQNGDFPSPKSIALTNQPPGTYYLWLINDGGATTATNTRTTL